MINYPFQVKPLKKIPLHNLIAHYFKSFYLHGIHSPFVFDFVHKGLQSAPKMEANRMENALLKCVSYFEVKSVFCASRQWKKKLNEHYPDLIFDSSVYDIVIWEFEGKELLTAWIEDERIQNRTLIFIPNLRTQYQAWQRMMALPQVSVSINAYLYGILFLRKEQMKENFRILP